MTGPTSGSPGSTNGPASSGFDVSRDADRTTISYAAPQPILLAVAQDVLLRLDFSGSGLTMTNPLLAVELSQKTRISLRAESLLPLERLAEHLHQVRNFFCFAKRDAAST